MTETNEREQFDLFKAETTWFHIFRDMIESGDVAKMGASAFTVYAVIKAHTNFSTGRAFPAIETIVEKSGISKRQIVRDLQTLEEHGYISKTKHGRSNVYQLREKIAVKDDHGRPVAAASWDYLPSGVTGAMADLKNVLMSGDFAGAKIVNIERLTVNINNLHDNATQFNVAQLMSDMDKLPAEMREKLQSAFQASRGRKPAA
jgi:DNA-binding transcriptional MocR family regulator